MPPPPGKPVIIVANKSEGRAGVAAAEAYDKMSYYERWIHSISQTLIQRGVITIDGSLDEEVWQRAEPASGGESPAPR